MSTKIQWSEETWNPTTGCDQISPGCENCYALTLAARLKRMGQAKYQNDGDPRTSGPGFGLTLHDDALDLPLRWKKPRLVFVDSMSDLFHTDVPEEFIAWVFAVMALTPRHTYQILTKRSQRCHEVVNAPTFGLEVMKQFIALVPEMGQTMFTERWPGWPLPNVWLGVSIETPRYKFRLDWLRRTRAALRFASLEPLLDDLGSLDFEGIGWAIVGGESGADARPMHLAWAYSVVRQCEEQGVPVFVKQLGSVWAKKNHCSHHKGGEPSEWPAHLRVREMPEVRP